MTYTGAPEAQNFNFLKLAEILIKTYQKNFFLGGGIDMCAFALVSSELSEACKQKIERFEIGFF